MNTDMINNKKYFKFSYKNPVKNLLKLYKIFKN